LRGSEPGAAAKDVVAGALGQISEKDTPNEALLRRMCEVAVRRVARKRGVAVETPQAKMDLDVLQVNVTYVDDGRVLDTPEDLTQAFQHAIETEVALKGFTITTELKLFRSKDGQVETLAKDGGDDEDVEMFACEICDGLVKETDNECPHCGAMFEDEEEEEQESPVRRAPPKRGGPPGPSKGGPPKKSGPPGTSKGGPPKKSGPPGPSKGGPPKKSGPPGPSRSGPPGPSKGGPPKKSGPPGPSRSGPPGPSKGGPPKKSGPPGPSKGGPPEKSGPPGPSKKGGPPKGGPSGPKRGPPR